MSSQQAVMDVVLFIGHYFYMTLRFIQLPKDPKLHHQIERRIGLMDLSIALANQMYEGKKVM